MASCSEIICQYIDRVKEVCGEHVLRVPALFRSCMVYELKINLPPPCLDIKNFVLDNIRCYSLNAETITIKYNIDPSSRMGSGTYRPYTLAEAIFIALYEEDPVNAHEKMYELLEPVLLSQDQSMALVKRALFIPLYPDIANILMAHYVSFLKYLKEDVRRDVCRYIEKSFKLLLSSLVNVKGGSSSYIQVNGDLFRLCPNLPMTI